MDCVPTTAYPYHFAKDARNLVFPILKNWREGTDAGTERMEWDEGNEIEWSYAEGRKGEEINSPEEKTAQLG